MSHEVTNGPTCGPLHRTRSCPVCVLHHIPDTALDIRGENNGEGQPSISLRSVLTSAVSALEFPLTVPSASNRHPNLADPINFWDIWFVGLS